MTRPLKVGDSVKVYETHWLRGGQVGKIIEQDPYRGTFCWLVQFPVKIDGKGIDGDKIWLDNRSLIPVVRR